MGLSTGEDYRGVLSGPEARKLIKLIFFSKDWISRRVDSVRFPDGLTLHRQVSVDFLVPEELPRVRLRHGTGFTLLPIALLRKEAMVNFSFWDSKNNPYTRSPGS
ncbi:hypothetical protein ACFV1W_38965 [Kitasatospora sp. NPDC059648]|uniref:hypothetical protein n=1 Tax=Kitasatospora sp. NPDC059648 TaxID=3346894 RepID=UPI003678B58F